MSEENVVAVVAIGCLFGGPMIWGIVDTVASNWRKAKIAEQDAVLKRDMIERGFSADEIAQVLGSESGGKRKMARNT